VNVSIFNDIMLPATERYFASWEHQFPGKFLHRNDNGILVPDRILMVDHCKKLSGGEQVYAGVWWELMIGTPTPWFANAESALATAFTHLDLDHLQRVVGLVNDRYEAQVQMHLR
jgi:hypothetical protein